MPCPAPSYFSPARGVCACWPSICLRWRLWRAAPAIYASYAAGRSGEFLSPSRPLISAAASGEPLQLPTATTPPLAGVSGESVQLLAQPPAPPPLVASPPQAAGAPPPAASPAAPLPVASAPPTTPPRSLVLPHLVLHIVCQAACEPSSTPQPCPALPAGPHPQPVRPARSHPITKQHRHQLPFKSHICKCVIRSGFSAVCETEL